MAVVWSFSEIILYVDFCLLDIWVLLSTENSKSIFVFLVILYGFNEIFRDLGNYIDGKFIFISLNFQFRRLHSCVWKKCCLLRKRFDSSCHPRKQVVILSDQVLSPIETASWVIASCPRWHSKKNFASSLTVSNLLL